MMKSQMKIAFNSGLEYQQDAMQAVTDLFEGQPIAESEFNLSSSNSTSYMGEFGNQLIISKEQILKNIRSIQDKHELSLSSLTDIEELNFSIEMETGTGKTYVYLRTIYELNLLYGFKKFVIVVPSIAIREGVLKNLQITHAHFQNIYNNVPVNYCVYSSDRVSQLRGFSANNNIEIMIINIDAFAKDENVINRPNDRLSGKKPIEFIQAVCPVVIIDEPQNMETEKRKAAIESLNPLCTLRYSATHKYAYNLVYRLDPVKAYDLGLVKQIEVDSVIEENNLNSAYIQVESVTPQKTKITGKVSILVNSKNGAQKKVVSLSEGDDLYEKSNHNDLYKEGYIINGFDAEEQSIALSNGQVILKSAIEQSSKDDVMKYQIRRTVEEHLNKEARLIPQGIKVLSLFFIDKVSNYRVYDEGGQYSLGKIGKWFEEAYNEVMNSSQFESLKPYLNEGTFHDGYFSQDKKGKIKDTRGESKEDADTYNLIMKDKEKLLSLDNPLRFIFSHSALREGWDNPNVFQVCTLNESYSEMRKRQEIGRGLRLAVNQNGERIHDKNINRLTVIANESYDDFAKNLQQEIEADYGISFGNRIKNKRERQSIKYRKGFECDALFLSIWEKIRQKTTYRVNYDTQTLIANAAAAIKEMPRTIAPAIRSTKILIDMTDEGVQTKLRGSKLQELRENWSIPDVLGYIQNRTSLTRHTIFMILQQSGRLDNLVVNPQMFLDQSVEIIRKELQKLMIEGIQYKKIGNECYEMKLFYDREVEIYLDNAFVVDQPSKTIYENLIPIDSETESQFARDCETSEQVLFYFKLPSWFRVPTPIGDYIPDWAVVFQGEKQIYFVAETKNTGKGTVDLLSLRENEQLKMKCGEAHFKEFSDVSYRAVSRVTQLVE